MGTVTERASWWDETNTGGDLATSWDTRHVEYKELLSEFVVENPHWWAVGLASPTPPPQLSCPPRTLKPSPVTRPTPR